MREKAWETHVVEIPVALLLQVVDEGISRFPLLVDDEGKVLLKGCVFVLKGLRGGRRSERRDHVLLRREGWTRRGRKVGVGWWLGETEEVVNWEMVCSRVDGES